MEEKQDFVILDINNGNQIIENYQDAGFDQSNLTMHDAQWYIDNVPEIRGAFTDQATGKFDEAGYTRWYKSKASKYAHFKDPEFETNFSDYITLANDDATGLAEWRKRKYNEEVSASLVANPFNVSKNFIGEGESESPYSARELASMNRYYDSWTGQYIEDPSGSLKSFWDNVSPFSPTKILAQYDEDGYHIDTMTGMTVAHKKGDYKTNNYGQLFYETASSGQNLNEKQIMNPFDNITRPDSWLNRYNVFDSDGKDKTVLGSTIRTAIKLAPAFVPGVGVYYVGAGVTFTVLDYLSKIANSVQHFLTGEYSSTLYNYNNWTKRFNQTNTDYAQQNTWAFENVANMTYEVVNQLMQQRWIFDVGVPTLIRGIGKFTPKTSTGNFASYVKDAKYGFYMNNSEEASSYYKFMRNKWMDPEKRALWMKERNQKQLSILNNANKKENVLLSDNVIARSQLLAKDETSAYLMRLAEKNTDFAKNLSQVHMTALVMSDTYQSAIDEGATRAEAATLACMHALGEWWILNTGVGEHILPEFREARNLNKKLAKDIYKQFHKDVLKATGNDANALTTEIIESSNIFGKYYKKIVQAIKDNSGPLSKGAMGSLTGGIAEGVEEVSEEMLIDGLKGVMNGLEYLGVFNNNKGKFNETTFDVVDSMGDRYIQSFIGGFMGGAIFNFHPMFADAKKEIAEKMKNPNVNIVGEIADLIYSGKIDEFLDTVDGMTFGSKKLSTESQIGIDGSIIPIPADRKRLSQNDEAHMLIHDFVNMIKSDMLANDINLTSRDKINELIRQDERYKFLQHSTAANAYITEYNNLSKDILNANNDLKNATELRKSLEGKNDDKSVREYNSALSAEKQAENKLIALIEKKDKMFKSKNEEDLTDEQRERLKAIKKKHKRYPFFNFDIQDRDLYEANNTEDEEFIKAIRSSSMSEAAKKYMKYAMWEYVGIQKMFGGPQNYIMYAEMKSGKRFKDISKADLEKYRQEYMEIEKDCLVNGNILPWVEQSFDMANHMLSKYFNPTSPHFVGILDSPDAYKGKKSSEYIEKQMLGLALTNMLDKLTFDMNDDDTFDWRNLLTDEGYTITSEERDRLEEKLGIKSNSGKWGRIVSSNFQESEIDKFPVWGQLYEEQSKANNRITKSIEEITKEYDEKIEKEADYGEKKKLEAEKQNKIDKEIEKEFKKIGREKYILKDKNGHINLKQTLKYNNLLLKKQLFNHIQKSVTGLKKEVLSRHIFNLKKEFESLSNVLDQKDIIKHIKNIHGYAILSKDIIAMTKETNKIIHDEFYYRDKSVLEKEIQTSKGKRKLKNILLDQNALNIQEIIQILKTIESSEIKTLLKSGVNVEVDAVWRLLDIAKQVESYEDEDEEKEAKRSFLGKLANIKDALESSTNEFKTILAQRGNFELDLKGKASEILNKNQQEKDDFVDYLNVQIDDDKFSVNDEIYQILQNVNNMTLQDLITLQEKILNELSTKNTLSDDVLNDPNINNLKFISLLMDESDYKDLGFAKYKSMYDITKSLLDEITVEANNNLIGINYDFPIDLNMISKIIGEKSADVREVVKHINESLHDGIEESVSLTKKQKEILNKIKDTCDMIKTMIQLTANNGPTWSQFNNFSFTTFLNSLNENEENDLVTLDYQTAQSIYVMFDDASKKIDEYNVIAGAQIEKKLDNVNITELMYRKKLSEALPKVIEYIHAHLPKKNEYQVKDGVLDAIDDSMAKIQNLFSGITYDKEIENINDVMTLSEVLWTNLEDNLFLLFNNDETKDNLLDQNDRNDKFLKGLIDTFTLPDLLNMDSVYCEKEIESIPAKELLHYFFSRVSVMNSRFKKDLYKISKNSKYALLPHQENTLYQTYASVVSDHTKLFKRVGGLLCNKIKEDIYNTIHSTQDDAKEKMIKSIYQYIDLNNPIFEKDKIKNIEDLDFLNNNVIMPIYFDIPLLQGVAGAGKTVITSYFLPRMLGVGLDENKKDLMYSHITVESATKAIDGTEDKNGEKIHAITCLNESGTNLSSSSQEEVMEYIFGTKYKIPYDETGFVIGSSEVDNLHITADKTGDRAFISRLNDGVNGEENKFDINQIGCAGGKPTPKLIIIDEITTWTDFALETLYRWASNNNVSIVALGDFTQTKIKGDYKHPITEDSDISELNSSRFGRTLKNSISIRSNNSIMSLNNKRIENIIKGFETKDNITLKDYGKIGLTAARSDHELFGTILFNPKATNDATGMSLEDNIMVMLNDPARVDPKTGKKEKIIIVSDEDIKAPQSHTLYQRLSQTMPNYMSEFDFRTSRSVGGLESLYYVCDVSTVSAREYDVLYTVHSRAKKGCILTSLRPGYRKDSSCVLQNDNEGNGLFQQSLMNKIPNNIQDVWDEELINEFNARRKKNLLLSNNELDDSFTDEITANGIDAIRSDWKKNKLTDPSIWNENATATVITTTDNDEPIDPDPDDVEDDSKINDDQQTKNESATNDGSKNEESKNKPNEEYEEKEEGKIEDAEVPFFGRFSMNNKFDYVNDQLMLSATDDDKDIIDKLTGKDNYLLKLMRNEKALYDSYNIGLIGFYNQFYAHNNLKPKSIGPVYNKIRQYIINGDWSGLCSFLSCKSEALRFKYINCGMSERQFIDERADKPDTYQKSITYNPLDPKNSKEGLKIGSTGIYVTLPVTIEGNTIDIDFPVLSIPTPVVALRRLFSDFILNNPGVIKNEEKILDEINNMSKEVVSKPKDARNKIEEFLKNHAADFSIANLTEQKKFIQWLTIAYYGERFKSKNNAQITKRYNFEFELPNKGIDYINSMIHLPLYRIFEERSLIQDQYFYRGEYKEQSTISQLESMYPYLNHSDTLMCIDDFEYVQNNEKRKIKNGSTFVVFSSKYEPNEIFTKFKEAIANNSSDINDFVVVYTIPPTVNASYMFEQTLKEKNLKKKTVGNNITALRYVERLVLNYLNATNKAIKLNLNSVFEEMFGISIDDVVFETTEINDKKRLTGISSYNKNIIDANKKKTFEAIINSIFVLNDTNSNSGKHSLIKNLSTSDDKVKNVTEAIQLISNNIVNALGKPGFKTMVNTACPDFKICLNPTIKNKGSKEKIQEAKFKTLSKTDKEKVGYNEQTFTVEPRPGRVVVDYSYIINEISSVINNAFGPKAAQVNNNSTGTQKGTKKGTRKSRGTSKPKGAKAIKKTSTEPAVISTEPVTPPATNVITDEEYNNLINSAKENILGKLSDGDYIHSYDLNSIENKQFDDKRVANETTFNNIKSQLIYGLSNLGLSDREISSNFEAMINNICIVTTEGLTTKEDISKELESIFGYLEYLLNIESNNDGGILEGCPF